MDNDPADAIRHAIQAMLDGHPDSDGWTVTQHCIAMGLERVVDGRIESSCWVWSPPSQPDWMTAGLLEQALVLRDEEISEG